MEISRRTIYIVAATFVLVVAVVCSTLLIVTRMSAPPTVTPTPPLATLAIPPTATAIPTAMPTATPSPEPTQAAGACGQHGSTTILLLGESLPEDHQARGASAIRLIRVDYDTKIVRVLALPPYLRVNTPALSSVQIDATALTLVYQEALQIGSGSDRAKMAYASDVFAQTLDDNFGLVPDHFISIRQGVFVNTIDALGGLSIDLPEDVDGLPSQSGTYNAGPQVLDGQEVLDYVSMISTTVEQEPPTEWGRLERQEQVIQALYAQLAQPETLLKLPNLLRQFQQDVVTDLGLSQMLILACMLQEPDVSIEHLELDTDLVTPGEDNILLPKTDQIITYLETTFVQ
ncbi:MAG: LCP family protein [Chloroflexi bacterium]|nr:LCP family protein [Chloroflexota bacterium]